MKYKIPRVDKSAFLNWLFLFLMLEILSFFSFVYFDLNTMLAAAITVVFFWISLYKLEWGMMAIIAELLIGVQGHLFVLSVGGFSLPLRMIFFIVWLSLWLVHVFFHERQRFRSVFKKFGLEMIALGALILYGAARGVLNGNNFGDIFFDANGWLYWLYLLPFMMSSIPFSKLWPLFAAGVVWIVAKSMIVLYIFSHQFETVSQLLYFWLRDFRLAEITLFGSLWRVFSQNQVFILLGLSLAVMYLAYSSRLFSVKKEKWIVLGAASYLAAGTVMSFSRSFWLGAAAGAFFFLVSYAFFAKGAPRIPWAQAFPSAFLALLFGIAGLWALIYFPVPRVGISDPSSLVTARLGSEEAANARLKLIGPLWKSVSDSLLWGKGFGTTVTYYTSDPRVVAQSAGGTGAYTTYAFEWGYLDIWLKVGLVGLALYLFVLFRFFQDIWRRFVSAGDPFFAGLALSLLMLFALNTTTPFLNHPLGIGYVLVAMILARSYHAYEPSQL